jgi:hypothetical protein
MAEQQRARQAPQDRGLVSQTGRVTVDWPRSIGYYGGISLAVATGMIEPPLAMFGAAIPFLKMLNRPTAAKPVGGSSEATIELAPSNVARQPRRPSIWQEARDVADRMQGKRYTPMDPSPNYTSEGKDEPAHHSPRAQARSI